MNAHRESKGTGAGRSDAAHREDPQDSVRRATAERAADPDPAHAAETEEPGPNSDRADRAEAPELGANSDPAYEAEAPARGDPSAEPSQKRRIAHSEASRAVAPRPLVSRSDSPASGAASPSAPDGPPRRKRAEKSQARREAILAAALDEFTERGFALTRIDDVARRAGVGKGTIYLHFKDKEALFQQLVITMLGPVVAQLARLPDVDEPVRSVLERVFALFATEVYGTKRPEVLRLVLAEGPRFPHLAEFYYRHVVEPATTMLRRLLDRACARGEIRQERLSQFPQLVVAPALVAIIWRGLFDRFEPLDMAGLMRAHLDLLFAPGDGP
ncbi:MAG TPA: TetR family transcriptional regulator [Rhodoplanes sp.]|nr:TetR family transcriptional regulator [Rhodoplanes sp.]